MILGDLKIEKNLLESLRENSLKTLNIAIFEKEFYDGINVERFYNDNTLNLPPDIIRETSSIITSIKISHNCYKNKTQNKKFRPLSIHTNLEILSQNVLEANNKITEFNSFYRSKDKDNIIADKLIFEKNENGTVNNLGVFEIPETSENIQIIDNSPRIQKEILLEDIMHNNYLQKLIFNKDVTGLFTLLNKFETHKNLLQKLLDTVDLRGNTAVMLCVLLRSKEKSQELLKMIKVLLKYDANPKIRNSEKCTPLEAATCLEDFEAVCLIFEHLLKRRKTKIIKNLERTSMFLSIIPNFYMEMNWEINVPLIGFLCPKDTCKIWKFERNVRMDYTFSQFKNLSSVRRPTSFILKEIPNIKEINVYRVDHMAKTYFNNFEPLEEDEKILVVQEIMNRNRLNGEFKLKNCNVSESKSYFGSKSVFEIIDGIKAKKYEVNLSAWLNIHTIEKFEYENLDHTNYFIPEKSLTKKSTTLMDEQKLKTHIADNLKVKNDKIRNQIMKISDNKDKKLKAYIWIAENYPIKSSDLVTLFDSLSSANEYTQKIKEFLNDPEIKKIIEKNGFPIKIKIPVNIFVDVTVTFTKFKELKENFENEIKEKYEIPKNYKNLSRKLAQNLAENHKFRMGYANIQG